MRTNPIRHTIPLQTHAAFEGDSIVYIVTSYQTLLACDKDCPHDHDHYEEPYIHVEQRTGKAFPLSKLKHIFDAQGYGHLYQMEILDDPQ